MRAALDRYQISGPGGLLFLGLLLAVLVAGLVFVFYPASFVTGSHPFWRDPTGDLAQHSTGANYFVLGSWNYPLFHVPGLGLPGGTSIVYTDSLPLMALLFRIIRLITGEAQLYFSYWVFGSALLQAPCFSLALYAAGVRNGLVLALGGLIALFSPVWWFAFSHVQLFGHFMILVGLALYFLASRADNWTRIIPWFMPLLIAAMMVSGYMFLMIAMLFGLSLLSTLWHDRMSALSALLCVAAAGVFCLGVMVVGGYLGTTLIPKNYGLFSLNLLGFLTPQMSGLVPGLDDYVLDATGGQSQGFAYLGLGVLLLAALALWLGRSGFAAGLRRDPILLFGGLAILLYAASYAVYAGPYLVAGISHETFKQAFLRIIAGEISAFQAIAALSLLDYLRLGCLVLLAAALPLGLSFLAWRQGKRQLLWFLAAMAAALVAALLVSPKSIIFGLGTLHASGRYAWLLVYLIMVVTIASLARRLMPLHLVAVLALALAVQIVDSGPVQERLRAEIRRGEDNPLDDRLALEAALGEAQRFILSPNFLCSKIEIEDRIRGKSVAEAILRLEFLASQAAVPVNSVMNARKTTVQGLVDLPDCGAERRHAVAGAWGPGTAYLFLAEATPQDVQDRLLSDDRRCRALVQGVLCRDP